MGNRASKRKCFLGLCGLVLLFAQGCEELPKVQGFYFELEPVFETYNVDAACNPTTLFTDWPTGQPPQTAPFGASVTQALGSIGGMFLPPYPIVPAFNVHGINNDGVISIDVQETNPLKVFRTGLGYRILFNGNAVDQNGDNVADVIVLDPNRDNYALVYDQFGDCSAYVDTSSSQNYLTTDNGLDEIVTAYVRSFEHTDICWAFDQGSECVDIGIPLAGACLLSPLDILIHINWDTFLMAGENLDQGVTFSLSHDPVEPNRVLFGNWEGDPQQCLNTGRITAWFGPVHDTKTFRGAVNLDVGGTLIRQAGRLQATEVWIDLLDPHIDINNFPDEVEDWALEIYELFADDVENMLADLIEEEINNFLDAL